MVCVCDVQLIAPHFKEDLIEDLPKYRAGGNFLHIWFLLIFLSQYSKWATFTFF